MTNQPKWSERVIDEYGHHVIVDLIGKPTEQGSKALAALLDAAQERDAHIFSRECQATEGLLGGCPECHRLITVEHDALADVERVTGEKR